MCPDQGPHILVETTPNSFNHVTLSLLALYKLSFLRVELQIILLLTAVH
jgi:hypothetical protein